MMEDLGVPQFFRTRPFGTKQRRQESDTSVMRLSMTAILPRKGTKKSLSAGCPVLSFKRRSNQWIFVGNDLQIVWVRTTSMLLYQQVYAQLQGGAPASFSGHDLVGSRATSL